MANGGENRSFHKLITSIYGYNKPNKVYSNEFYLENNKIVNFNGQFGEAPLSFLNFGKYNYSSNGNISLDDGRFLTKKAAFLDAVIHLFFTSTSYKTMNNFNKGMGYSLRCVAKSFINK